jgi:hypothetical protein
MRLWLCFSIMVLLSVSTFAQEGLSNAAIAQEGSLRSEQIKGEVDRLFNSVSIRDRAWAAYAVGQFGLREYAPLIVDLIQQSSSDLREDNHIACRVFFDSLIQLDVAVSADQLMPLYRAFPDEVMILLAKFPKENQEALLSIAKQANPERDARQYWLAACNLLAEIEARGFAAHLLSESTIELSVAVTDPNTGTCIGPGAGMSIGCGAGYGALPPDGFPPIAVYLLVEEASNGRVVVAPGLRTIYYQRTVVEAGKHGRIGSGRSHIGWNKNLYVLEYVAKLLRTTTDRLGFTKNPSRTVTWTSGAEYRQMVQMHRREIERSYEEVKNRLIERGLLSVSEAESLAPKITVKVFDYRHDKTIKLPEI